MRISRKFNALDSSAESCENPLLLAVRFCSGCWSFSCLHCSRREEYDNEAALNFLLKLALTPETIRASGFPKARMRSSCPKSLCDDRQMISASEARVNSKR